MLNFLKCSFLFVFVSFLFSAFAEAASTQLSSRRSSAPCHAGIARPASDPLGQPQIAALCSKSMVHPRPRRCLLTGLSVFLESIVFSHFGALLSPLSLEQTSRHWDNFGRGQAPLPQCHALSAVCAAREPSAGWYQPPLCARQREGDGL